MNKFIKLIGLVSTIIVFATSMAFSTGAETLGPAATVDLSLDAMAVGAETITLVANNALSSVDLRTTAADTAIGTMQLDNTDRDGFTLTFSTDSEAVYSAALLIMQNEANTAGSIATNADAAAWNSGTNPEGYFVPWLLEVQLDAAADSGTAGFATSDPAGTSGGGTAMMSDSGGDPEGVITIDSPTNATVAAIYTLKCHTTADTTLFDGTFNATLNIVMADIN